MTSAATNDVIVPLVTLLCNALPGSDRENVRQAQGSAAHRNPLRQIPNRIPLRNRSRSNRNILVMCVDPNERLIVTNFEGGVTVIEQDGTLIPYLLSVDGIDLPPTNFVHLDAFGRVWITVSTRQVPRSLGYSKTVSDGFLVFVDENGACIVADNLGFTNECLVTPDGAHIYVNETFSRRVRKFAIAQGGPLREVAVFEDFEEGEFPDGMALDQEGGLWIASIISNRIIRVAPDFGRDLIVDGRDTERVQYVEKRYLAGMLTSADLGASNGSYGNLLSLAFGGNDLNRVYLGNLLCDTVAHFRQPMAGQQPSHWHFDGPKRRV